MSTLLTIGELLARTATFFKNKEIDQPRLTAEVLLCHVAMVHSVTSSNHLSNQNHCSTPDTLENTSVAIPVSDWTALHVAS